MIQPIRLLRGFATVGVWTLLSRILGFVRDVLIAGFLGSTAAAEAFLIAFSLPNMFRRFFAEGAFNMAFVPMFSKKIEAGSQESASEFAGDAFVGLASILIVFSLLAQAAMPALVYAMASGFYGDDRFDLAVFFGRIAFPYILFISLAALISGALNALGRFAAAAAAPVLLNIILIAAIAFGAMGGWNIALTMTIAVPFAGIAQLALVWVALRRAGFVVPLRWPRLTPELRRLAVIAAPAALAGGVVQVNLLVGRQVASRFDGAIAWLSYADRLYQLPLGLVGVAIGAVLLPDLSRRLQAEDGSGARNAFNRALEYALLLTLPAAVALVVIPLPLVSVLFERGAFEASDSQATALAVAIYGLGLPAFVLQKIIMPLYFAREDTRTPFRFAVVAMVVNAVLAFGLMLVWGYLAAAVATTLSSWVLLALLWRGSRGMGDAARLDDGLRRSLPRMVLSCAVMAVAVFAAAQVFGPWLEMSGMRYVALGLLVAVGAVVYGAVVLASGAVRIADLRAALRR